MTNITYFANSKAAQCILQTMNWIVEVIIINHQQSYVGRNSDKRTKKNVQIEVPIK